MVSYSNALKKTLKTPTWVIRIRKSQWPKEKGQRSTKHTQKTTDRATHQPY